MTTLGRRPSLWTKLPITLRAILAGFLIAAAAANVWLLLLLNLGVQLAAVIEAIFLALFVRWACGETPPSATQTDRAKAFRRSKLTFKQWSWGLTGAFFFAATVHASIVLLFRSMPYPAAAFRHGYDLSFIPSLSLRWIAVVISAASAGICEEIGFRGFMQQPIEQRHGAPVAIFISSFFFMALHLTNHRVWCRRIARPSRMVRGIAHSGDHRSFCDGRRTIRLLVDRYRWRLHRASDHRNRCGSVLPDRMLCVCDLACCRAACDLETT
jgi:membrane protease YdiL (CAAX protease family)